MNTAVIPVNLLQNSQGASMLLVKHHVAPSPIHGLGVFADEFIRKGDLVYRFHPAIDRIIGDEEFRTLPPHVQMMVETHAEWLPGQNAFRLGSDGDFYMNHADAPNLVDADEKMFAAKDIKAGEELTCDYAVVRVKAHDFGAFA